MLAHRRRRWANISPVLGYRVMFGATLNVGQRHRRRDKINLFGSKHVTVLNRHHAGKAEWSTD